MFSHIEDADRRQLKLWGGFLVAFYLLLALLFVRYLLGTVFREYGLNNSPLGVFILIVSVALLVMLITIVVRLGLEKARAAANPELKEALLDNELNKLHLHQSWKAGFLGAVATPFLFLVGSVFYPINDLLLVSLTTISIGSGSFLTSYYLKSIR